MPPSRSNTIVCESCELWSERSLHEIGVRGRKRVSCDERALRPRPRPLPEGEGRPVRRPIGRATPL